MIEIKNLNIMNQDSCLIPNLNMTFKQGEFWAILGKNGTGKTTLLHTLAGLLNYNSGEIKINGHNLSEISPMTRAQLIGLLSQHMETGLNCTVEQSIAYGRYPWHKLKHSSQEEQSLIDNAINDMQLKELKKKSIQEISGGELRKVEIATILAQNSNILMNLLKQLSNKKLIIMVTHDIQYVKAYCTHVMFLLNNGQAVYGLTEDMMDKDNINKMLEINLPENVLL